MKPNCSELQVKPGISLYHSGPSLGLGPLPSFFYFAISGIDSLTKDPFNQPVQFLQGEMIRVFSMTLPGHEPPLDPKNALDVWADDFKKGRDPIGSFLDAFQEALKFAIDEKFIDPNRISIGGLSRGGLIALHAAKREDQIKKVLCFAPVTVIEKVKEFKGMDLSAYNAPILSEKQIRMYMSNRDTRVGTRECFDYLERSVKTSPKTELIIYPAIGYQGHGTPPEIFSAGARWIKE